MQPMTEKRNESSEALVNLGMYQLLGLPQADPLVGRYHVAELGVVSRRRPYGTV